MAEWPLCSAAWVIMDTAVSHFSCQCVCTCVYLILCMYAMCVFVCVPCVLRFLCTRCVLVMSHQIHAFIAITYFCEHFGVTAALRCQIRVHTKPCKESKIHATCPRCHDVCLSLSLSSLYGTMCSFIIGLYPHLVVLHINAAHPFVRL